MSSVSSSVGRYASITRCTVGVNVDLARLVFHGVAVMVLTNRRNVPGMLMKGNVARSGKADI
jgi:hypothetical protein